MTFSSVCYDGTHTDCDLEECECDCHGFDDDGGDEEELEDDEELEGEEDDDDYNPWEEEE